VKGSEIVKSTKKLKGSDGGEGKEMIFCDHEESVNENASDNEEVNDEGDHDANHHHTDDQSVEVSVDENEWERFVVEEKDDVVATQTYILSHCHQVEPHACAQVLPQHVLVFRIQHKQNHDERQTVDPSAYQQP